MGPADKPVQQEDHFMSVKGNGKLRLYHLFPRNYDRMSDAIDDLDRIGQLGFNAIWVSPLSPSSNVIVSRFNDLTTEAQSVKGSLYAATDFSRLNQEMFPDLADPTGKNGTVNGNPGYSSQHERNMLHKFTSKAKKKGLQPIFDLVLNHVGAESPLILGTCSHFKEKGIDTKKWFKEKSEKWDDVYLFNYLDPVIKEEILRELWIPYITKYINDFGFDGIRMDFAGGRQETRAVERRLSEEIKRLVAVNGSEAIIYAEVLPPASKMAENASALRGIYTHATNSTLWGVDETAVERGLKQQITHLMPDGSLRALPGGTIGFAGSHDHGPNARNALKSAAMITINRDESRREAFYGAFDKKQAHELEGAITEQVELALGSRVRMNACLIVQRQRLALVALASDGGWCLLGGDELGKMTPASVFVDEHGKPVYGDAKSFTDAKQQTTWHHTGLIRDINDAIAAMPRATFPHWSKVLMLPAPHEDLVIVMNYNGWEFVDPEPVLTIVNVTGESVEISDNLIEKIAQICPEAKDSVLKAKKQLIGLFSVHLETYEATAYYHPENTPVFALSEADSSEITNEVLVWETDVQKGEIAEIDLTSPKQLQQFSMFKQKTTESASTNKEHEEETQLFDEKPASGASSGKN